MRIFLASILNVVLFQCYLFQKNSDYAKKTFLIGPVLKEVRVVLGLRGMKKNFELGQKNIFLFFYL